jgi:hypothetical protein
LQLFSSYTLTTNSTKMIFAAVLLLAAVAAAEECQMACPMNYDPLCGTDGETYSNECQLVSFSCMKKTKVGIRHSGACVEARPECNIACTLDYTPVCGTDGQTYGNACELDSLACLRRSSVSIAHQGACITESVIPEPKVCNEACLRNWVPVCGTDGITYGNMCQMESLACMKRINVMLAHEGEC